MAWGVRLPLPQWPPAECMSSGTRPYAMMLGWSVEKGGSGAGCGGVAHRESRAELGWLVECAAYPARKRNPPATSMPHRLGNGRCRCGRGSCPPVQMTLELPGGWLGWEQDRAQEVGRAA